MNTLAPDRREPRSPRLEFAASLAGFTLAYVLLAQLALKGFSLDANVCLFWPASGLALGVLILGGPRYAWGVALGTLLEGTLSGHSVLASLVLAAGNVAEAMLAYKLVEWFRHRHDAQASLNARFQFMLVAGALAASLSTFIGTGLLLAVGWVTPAQFWTSAMHWWMGDVLGIALVTPLVQVWRGGLWLKLTASQWAEALLVLGVSLLAGQVIFLGWLSIELSLLSRQGYWMFFFVPWTAIRLGSRAVVLLLLGATAQAFLGAQAGVGFFADDLALHRPSNIWFYLMALTLVGMSLSTYLAQLRRFAHELRIAAIAFEAQTGMAVLDAQGRVLRINRAFTRITGFEASEIVGRPGRDLVSSKGVEPTMTEALWQTAARTGGSQQELMHSHKSGLAFPAFVTLTAVTDVQGRVTHHVATIANTALARQREQQRAAREAAHRNALVREVHHRIKNNLQGITGLLRQFAQHHPETADLIHQAIGQVQGIAVVHGLQGQGDPHAVHLARLIPAIAEEVGMLWRTRIEVDIDPAAAAYTLSEPEAVPMALVLNELILNAVKHGGQQAGHSRVTLRVASEPDRVRIEIHNPGRLRRTEPSGQTEHTGLQLVRALLPRSGIQWRLEQQDNEVLTRLDIGPPIIKFDRKEAHETAMPDPSTPASGG